MEKSSHPKQLSEKSELSRSIMIASPAMSILHLVVQLLSCFIPALLLVKAIRLGNPWILAGSLIAGFYVCVLIEILLYGLIIRALPKPKSRKISGWKESLKAQILLMITFFLRNSLLARNFYFRFPFPGYWFYRLCGSRIASSAHLGHPDAILDPYLVDIGENTVVGYGAIIISHLQVEDGETFQDRIKIGNNVIIGAYAIICAGAIISDNSVVKAQACVHPWTKIPPYEVWGGNPAKKIKDLTKKN